MHKFQKTKLLKMPHTLWINALLGTHSRTGLKSYKIANRETSKYMALNRKEGEEIDRGTFFNTITNTHNYRVHEVLRLFFLHCINAVIQCETWISTHTEQNKSIALTSIALKPVTTNRTLTRGAVGTRGMGHFSRVAVHKLLAAS